MGQSGGWPRSRRPKNHPEGARPERSRRSPRPCGPGKLLRDRSRKRPSQTQHNPPQNSPPAELPIISPSRRTIEPVIRASEWVLVFLFPRSLCPCSSVPTPLPPMRLRRPPSTTTTPGRSRKQAASPPTPHYQSQKTGCETVEPANGRKVNHLHAKISSLTVSVKLWTKKRLNLPSEPIARWPAFSDQPSQRSTNLRQAPRKALPNRRNALPRRSCDPVPIATVAAAPQAVRVR